MWGGEHGKETKVRPKAGVGRERGGRALGRPAGTVGGRSSLLLSLTPQFCSWLLSLQREGCGLPESPHDNKYDVKTTRPPCTLL